MPLENSLLTGPALQPLSGDKPEKIVIFLHGLGADGQDLIGLAPHFANQLQNVLFLAPDAPDACDMAPFGYQWFSLQDRSYNAMLAGIESAAPKLNAFIDRQLDIYGLEAEDIALVGFSQGTMMALYTALRRNDCVAAIVGFSGALIAPEALGAEIAARPPVCLIHGDADPVVPYDAMLHAEKGLQAVDVSVETHTRPHLGHGIDQEGIRTALAFLEKHLGSNTRAHGVA